MRATSKEYAEALFSLAKETALETELLEELQWVRTVFAETPAYAAFLTAPGIPLQERLDTIQSTFGAELTEYAVSFLSLLCEQGGAALLPACVEEYERLYHRAHGVSHATVISAAPLDALQQQALSGRLAHISGNRVEIRYETDPDLLGGVKVEMDGLLIDGSLRSRLKNLREVMGE